jgi:hypothetical protein
MKYLKTYDKLFESATVDPDKWEDFKDKIQSEILDKYNISINDLSEKLGDYSGKYNVYDPILIIELDDWESSDQVVDDIYKLNRISEELIGGNFVISTNKNHFSEDKNKSLSIITIKLSSTPDSRIVREHFNLKECYTDNHIDRSKGGLCDYETAIKILEWLHTFHSFFYPTEREAFKLVYNTLKELYNVQIVFSLPKFETERFEQVVCFEFLLSENKDLDKSTRKNIIYNKFPVFTINTNYTESPSISKRIGNASWDKIPCDKKERLLNFLKNEQF